MNQVLASIGERASGTQQEPAPTPRRTCMQGRWGLERGKQYGPGPTCGEPLHPKACRDRGGETWGDPRERVLAEKVVLRNSDPSLPLHNLRVSRRPGVNPVEPKLQVHSPVSVTHGQAY